MYFCQPRSPPIVTSSFLGSTNFKNAQHLDKSRTATKQKYLNIQNAKRTPTLKLQLNKTGTYAHTQTNTHKCEQCASRCAHMSTCTHENSGPKLKHRQQNMGQFWGVNSSGGSNMDVSSLGKPLGSGVCRPSANEPRCASLRKAGALSCSLFPLEAYRGKLVQGGTHTDSVL